MKQCCFCLSIINHLESTPCDTFLPEAEQTICWRCTVESLRRKQNGSNENLAATGFLPDLPLLLEGTFPNGHHLVERLRKFV